MSIPALSVKQPVLVNLIMILLVVSGLLSYLSMPQDEFPDVSIENIMVNTIMQGASPKEIEQLITIPLEEEISKIDEIDEMTSVSSDGASMIMIQMEAGVDNIFEKLTEVQNQIQMVEDFPEEAENPVVQELKITFETMVLAVSGNAPEHEVKKFVDDLEAELKLISGVGEVNVAGIREREIWIEADPHRLHSYGLSLLDVSNALGRRNLNLPGGTIKMGRGEFTVRTEAEFDNIEDILNTVLKEDGENGYLYLRDVATVKNTFEEPRSIGRLDGEPSVLITVNKDRFSNAITVVEKIRAVASDFESRLPAGMELSIVTDGSKTIRSRLRGLYQNIGLGLIMCIGTFTLFIGWRAAIMVTIGLPVAMFTTFLFIQAYGYSVNSIVLFSLILVLGLVVDDAIVVCENIYRHVEGGMPLKIAAVKATEEITWPVVATVLTTIAAFLPLLLMKGVMGKFFGIIPVVVTLALLASLFECFFILPSHVAEWGGSDRHMKGQHARPWILWLSGVYSKAINFLLKLRYVVVAATIALAFIAINLAVAHMDFILFGGRDLENFSISLEAAPGASMAETARIVGELEASSLPIARETPEVEHLISNVGSANRGPMIMSTGSNMAQLTFRLVPVAERELTGHEIKDKVREAIQNVTGARTITIEDARMGPPVGKAVQVRVKGDNFQTLKRISLEVQEYLSTIEGVKDIMDNFPPGKDEVRPVLDMKKVAALGLDVRTIATEIRGAFDGIEATKVHDGDEEIDVVVKYNEANRRSLANLADMYFATSQGMVPFSTIAVMERAEGFSAVSHHESKRTINVLADVEEGVTTSAKVNRQLIEHFADLGERYPGYALGMGGEFEDTTESLDSLFQAFIVSIILIYVILGGLFQSFLQPLVVMFAVPFAFVGVIFGFFISNQPLGMFSIIGIIALCGIVVNDSLILITFINSRRKMGLGRRESMIQAGAARLRPIILTSITTIAGLMPMAMGMFGVDQFLRPMAMALVWGLTFSTVLTLVVIPCVYAIFDDYATHVLRCPLGLTREEYRALGAVKD